MLIKKRSDIQPSEITDHSLYRQRRDFLQASAALIGGLLVTGMYPGAALAKKTGKKLPDIQKSPYGKDEKLTSYKDVTSYNNFYEFGTSKDDPAKNAHALVTDPWSVQVEGEIAKPGTYILEDILKGMVLEERIYRLRCVEAWSMVIPWVGFPLNELIKRFEPTSRAKYVEFTTLHDTRQMSGQKRGVLRWPYAEGLRMDEAMHPLTIMAVGLYGNTMPNQNGAPLRLVVPWKYGFKNIKSIVKIRFTEKLPKTTWALSAPREYGFYANVNPEVSHPRWSQAKERRIGSGSIFSPKIKTKMFNGYAEEVASLYSGMNLQKYF